MRSLLTGPLGSHISTPRAISDIDRSDCIPGANFQVWEAFREGVLRVSGSDFCINMPDSKFDFGLTVWRPVSCNATSNVRLYLNTAPLINTRRQNRKQPSDMGLVSSLRKQRCVRVSDVSRDRAPTAMKKNTGGYQTELESSMAIGGTPNGEFPC